MQIATHLVDNVARGAGERTFPQKSQKTESTKQDQNQRSEPEADSQVRSTSDDVLHAVYIPAYETHRWKEDSCSPNLDGNLAQGANKI